MSVVMQKKSFLNKIATTLAYFLIHNKHLIQQDFSLKKNQVGNAFKDPKYYLYLQINEKYPLANF